jgi:hypothetical protein
MTKLPFLIIIPTLNEERHLPRLLTDLSNQTFKDFQLVIVDGRSSDATLQKADSFKTKFRGFKVIISDKRNVAYQRNIGSKNAKTEWLIFMDADNRIPDYFLQGIKFQLEILKPDILSTWISPEHKTPTNISTANLINIFMDINKHAPYPFIFESMLIIKRLSFKKLAGFDTKITWHEGGDLLRRAQKMDMKYEFIKDPKYIYSFRRLRKIGAFKTLTGIAQHEFIRILNGGLDKKSANRYYPMEGGGFYKIDSEKYGGIQKLIKKLAKTKIF